MFRYFNFIKVSLLAYIICINQKRKFEDRIEINWSL